MKRPDRAEPQSTNLPAERRQRKILRQVAVYDPQPLDKPIVDGQFGKMGVVGRVLESFRYATACFEYNLAKSGWLRAWVRLFARLFCLFAVPTLAVLGLVWLLVPVFGGIAAIAGHLALAAKSLLVAVGCVALTAVIVAALVAAVKSGRR